MVFVVFAVAIASTAGLCFAGDVAATFVATKLLLLLLLFLLLLLLLLLTSPAGCLLVVLLLLMLLSSLLLPLVVVGAGVADAVFVSAAAADRFMPLLGDMLITLIFTLM